MAGKSKGRGRQPADPQASSGVTKVTLRLSDLTAKRLGVESVMTGMSQSDIAERVLASYLSAWRLPSKIGGMSSPTVDHSDGAESAA